MRRTAFTTVELLVSMAIGLVIAGTAFAAFRMAAQANAQVTRLSIQNTLMRTGILAALDELDSWNLYDSLEDGGPRPLRDPGEPFAPARFDPDAILLHRPQAWFRGDGAREFASADQFGRHHLFSAVGHADPVRAWLPTQLRGLADGIGYYAALDYAPAGTIFFWYETATHPVPARFRTTPDEGNTVGAMYNAPEAPQPADLYNISRGAYFVVSTGTDPEDALLGPYGNYHRHAFFALRSGSPSRWEIASNRSPTDVNDKRSLRDARKNALYEREMLLDLTPAEGGEGEGRPRHWPSLQLRRLALYGDGDWQHLVQVTLLDPITGEAMNVNLLLAGGTLRGARMLRGLDAR